MIYLTLDFLLFSGNFKETREYEGKVAEWRRWSDQDDKQRILAMMAKCIISVWCVTHKSFFSIVLT